MTSFNHNRAFIKGRDGGWKMINNYGRQVANAVYDQLLYDSYRDESDDLFRNGVALVKQKGEWIAIDTNGKILAGPKTFPGTFGNITRFGNVIVFGKDISLENSKYSFEYGFWNTSTDVFVDPMYHYIDMGGFDNELICAMKDDRIYYITNAGHVVWKSAKTKPKKNFLNIDFMTRGYYYAASAYKAELAGYGGWGGSDNQSKHISNNLRQTYSQLQIVIDTTRKASWNGYKGMKVIIANSSPDTLYFDAQDSRLYMTLQAKNRKGEWQDIEYLPSSWCGNSYHHVFLATNECWEFNAPIYHGEFKTKVRARLLYKKTIDQEVDDVVYSNEVSSSVNPGQFWNKREYTPQGIMDPYND